MPGRSIAHPSKACCADLVSEFVTGVLGQRPNFLGSTCQVRPLAPTCQLKRQVMVKGRDLLHHTGVLQEEAKQAFQSSLGYSCEL
jgi:hypothetical protein